MSQQILIKRSSVAGKTPTTVKLSLGELAINTYDGKVFLKKSVLGTESIVEVGATTLTGDVTGSGNGSIALTLSTTGVAAGTYTKLTVDTKGRVTAGSTLSTSDIPSLDWSKITSGKPTTLTGYGITVAATDIPSLDWSKITSGKPTTLTGYGITDAAPLTHVSDAAVHLTSAQNTWIDAITATSTEVNYLAGVTSAIQTQLNGNLPLAGGALTGLLTGAASGLAMSQDGGATKGSYVCRASGAGDANLAGMTFHNDAYAIKLGVRADGYFGLGGWSRAAWSWYSDPSGNMVAAGNVSAYSDERLKKNWRGVSPNLIEELSLVKHGIYDRIDEDLTQVGVSAQSLQTVFPEAVTEGIDGHLSVSYGNAALVAAIQLAKRIVELEARLNALESI